MILIFSAPSGSGKSTIINQLLQENLGLEFSISATSRPPRGKEQNGVEYYFLSTEEFREKIKNNEFVEYEEVYEGRFYGTLKSEITRIQSKGNIPVFDVDVVGGINIKKMYGKEAKSSFTSTIRGKRHRYSRSNRRKITKSRMGNFSSIRI